MNELPVHHTAGVVIECNDRFVLIVRKFENLLDVPSGHVNESGDIIESVLKHAKDETFIELKPRELVELGECEYIRGKDSGLPYVYGDHLHKVHLFFCRLESLPPMIPGGDAKNIKLLTWEDALNSMDRMIGSAKGAFELLKQKRFKSRVT
jgi:ADP-ribose pyrophosphatase YjhB (NUDIX family)